MPRAQTPPRSTRANSRVSPLPPKPPSRRLDSSPDVLELTSSDDTPLHPPHKHQKRIPQLTLKKKPKSNPKAQSQPVDVIEISSDEDDVPPSQESLIEDLRSQVKKLKQEVERYQNSSTSLAQELFQCHTELKEAKVKASQHQSTDGKLVLSSTPSRIPHKSTIPSTVRSVHAACTPPACEHYFVTPLTPTEFHREAKPTIVNRLPDCGHTFCLSCLRDWFGTAQARFIQAHPHWHQNTMNAYVQRLQTILRPEYLAHPQLYHQLQQLQQPTPEYTCPTCRKQVYRRPVEVYTLKSLVRTISAADEEEKLNIPPDQPYVEQRHGHLVVVDPWDGYFPRER
ncbi:hypothetical protein D9756_007459 [Leucocoprinus leucothites]|uniref:RING-type domain-containing protein n=1 Tax=Leucocoprinus leucothites TaxID=201217 RepID=A0A8H5D1I5_9AGAR|nr:hypothetical protein D9756_007459 [Leucoagaricus leucothites]